MYLIGQRRSCRPKGRRHCGRWASRPRRPTSSCSAPKGQSQPQKNATAPEQQGHGHVAPKDEDQGFQQKEVPTELLEQGVGEGQDIDHRKLRAGDPADPDQGEEQESDAQHLIKFLALRNGVLENKDRAQHQQPGQQGSDRELAVAPVALPERDLIRGALRRNSGLDVARRQIIGKIEEGEAAGPLDRLARDQELQPPGVGRIEALGLSDLENRDLAQFWRRLRFQPLEGPVVFRLEGNGPVALDQLKPIEEPAAAVVAALEGPKPAPGHQDNLIPCLETRHDGIVVALAQKIAADPRRCGQGREELDEGRTRIRRGNAFGKKAPATRAQRILGLAHRHDQAAQRAFRQEGRPIGRAEASEIEPVFLRPQQATAGRDGPCRAQNRVVHDLRGNRCARDRIDRQPGLALPACNPEGFADIEPAVLRDKAVHVILVDADNQDRLMMLGDDHAGDDTLQAQPDQQIQGLGRVAGRLDDLPAREDITDKVLATVAGDRGGGRLPTGRSDRPRAEPGAGPPGRTGGRPGHRSVPQGRSRPARARRRRRTARLAAAFP